MTNYLSIDPGKAGAVCIASISPSKVYLRPLPYIDSSVDPNALYRLLETFKPTYVFLESQTIYKGQGAKSSATTMRNYGRIEAVLDMYRTTRMCTLVVDRPRTWQKVIIPRAKKGETKKAAIEYVKAHYPEVDLRRTPRCTKDHDGYADAICMIDYLKTLTGQTND